MGSIGVTTAEDESIGFKDSSYCKCITVHGVNNTTGKCLGCGKLDVSGFSRVSAYSPTLSIGEAFIKHDQNKIMMSLVDPDFITGVADILTFGAKKYAKNNWQKNTEIDRYKDSLLRHLYAYLGGEMNDPESGKPHLDHIATNIMFLRYFEHGKGSE